MRWLILGALLLAGCGTSPSTDPCKTTPTFTKQIFPLIVQMKCLPCHSTSLKGDTPRMGAPADLDFDTYDLVMPNEAKFADAIVSGREPPPKAGQLTATTESERQLVDLWRACGYPK